MKLQNTIQIYFIKLKKITFKWIYFKDKFHTSPLRHFSKKLINFIVHWNHIK